MKGEGREGKGGKKWPQLFHLILHAWLKAGKDGEARKMGLEMFKLIIQRIFFHTLLLSLSIENYKQEDGIFLSLTHTLKYLHCHFSKWAIAWLCTSRQAVKAMFPLSIKMPKSHDLYLKCLLLPSYVTASQGADRAEKWWLLKKLHTLFVVFAVIMTSSFNAIFDVRPICTTSLRWQQLAISDRSIGLAPADARSMLSCHL